MRDDKGLTASHHQCLVGQQSTAVPFLDAAAGCWYEHGV